MSDSDFTPHNSEPIDNPDRSPAPPVDELAAIREQVAKRRAEEPKAPIEDVDPAPDRHFVVQCAKANDIGNGLLFAQLHRNKFTFNHQAAEWMVWRGSHWDFDITKEAAIAVARVVDCYLSTRMELYKLKQQAEDDGDKEGASRLNRQCKVLADQADYLRSIGGINNCLKAACMIDDPIAIRGDELDQEPWLLPVANGVLDLRTGKLRKGVPGEFLHRASGVEWRGMDAEAAAWDKFMLEIMADDEEMVAYLHRIFGYAITGLTNEHTFLVMEGEGRNGKGLLVETIGEILDDLAGPIPAEMLLAQKQARSSQGPSADIMELRGRRIAFASEPDDGTRFSAGKVKWYSGGDTLTGRYPHDKRMVRFKPTHQLVLLTNVRPHAPANDFAFWDRMHLVEFTRRFVNSPSADNELQRDPFLKEKLQKEYPGILARLVRGCLDYQQQGLNPPRKVLDATSEYRKDEDVMADFFEDCLISDGVIKDSYVLSATLYPVFERWWIKNVSAKNVPKMKGMGDRMRKQGFPSERIPREGNVKGYYGIRINPRALTLYGNG
jgi:putative DNA primase/helicase